ncbi:ABC transporter ATP-binding protein [Corynebacterium sp. HMSC29G08]|uniref:ATP-binding cassette domain-containing protein n=1 Tax=Corynebacterium sp. HMSC29G08 TaxID=1581069 RepID=UPI0008A4D553|nr:ABC transporter ATP-binding protein [Corynebacterium sp. HMSC29G08]OFT85206.1 hypothetical protein HMPREF3101_03430 [Corynebacterium sp. HMSC29G08]
MTTVRARNLQRSFGKKEVLNGVDFDLGPGIHGLLGRNGVGKSTLLSVIAGQLRPGGGDVGVDKQKPYDNPAVMDRMALTGVDVEYPPAWRLRDVLAAAALRYPGWDQRLADELVEDFGLEGTLRDRYGNLSRGQRAMTGIVVGLASATPLLLLDEPYVGLDTHNTQVFYRHLLEQADSGRTIIMATHHIEDAARILDSALILGRDGRISAHLTPEDADAYQVVLGETRTLIPVGEPAPTGTRTRPAGFDDLIENQLEAS